MALRQASASSFARRRVENCTLALKRAGGVAVGQERGAGCMRRCARVSQPKQHVNGYVF